MSDYVDEIVILAGLTIIFSSFVLLFNNCSGEKGIILSGFDVTCRHWAPGSIAIPHYDVP